MLEVITDQPGMQLYTGNFLDGTKTGHGGKVFKFRSGLCLESGHYPDSPNHPEFPLQYLILAIYSNQLRSTDFQLNRDQYKLIIK